MSARNPLAASTGQTELLITVPDAAKRLGVCRRTLEREIEHKRFPRPVKIGRKSLVPIAVLRAYLDKLTGPLPVL